MGKIKKNVSFYCPACGSSELMEKHQIIKIGRVDIQESYDAGETYITHNGNLAENEEVISYYCPCCGENIPYEKVEDYIS